MFVQLLCFGVVVLAVKAQKLPMDRIIHGKVVDISDFPYQVALINKRNRIICGGALVRPHVVFTAAHCTHVADHRKRGGLSVLVGANHVEDPKRRIHKIEKMVKHPDFSFGGFDNDFSVIVLQKPVEMNERSSTISVSTGSHRGGTTATASGWGQTEFGRPSRYLRAADLTIERWDRCQNYFPGFRHPRITRNMICVRPGRKTTYYGDSGGPLTINGELVGLVSFGRTVGGDKKTTVFTRVKNFMDFVEDVVPDFNSGGGGGVGGGGGDGGDGGGGIGGDGGIGDVGSIVAGGDDDFFPANAFDL